MSVMRAEHREIRTLLDQTAGELAATTGSWATSLQRLKELLLAHNTKEERVLYPMADAAARRMGSSGPLGEQLRAVLTEQA